MCGHCYGFTILLQSDIVYPDYFVLSNNVGLARYLENGHRKYNYY